MKLHLCTGALVLLCSGALSHASTSAREHQRGQPVPLPTGIGLLAGQVVDVGTGGGVGGIQVILIENGGSAQWRVNADSKGRFYFGQLPARTFAIQTVASDVGNTIASTSTGVGRLVTLADGERVLDLRIGILRMGSASGTVRDDAGDPVVGMTVVAFQRTFAGGRIVYPIRNRARTDDRGSYHLPLVPGEYLICACAVDPLPLDGGVLTTLAAQPLTLIAAAGRAVTLGDAAVQFDDTLRTYAPTFHPAATMPSRAERVTIASGEAKTEINIDVLAVRAARVSGHVVGATGPLLASSIRLRPADESGLVVVPDYQPMLTQPDGRFHFTGVPPGEYTLTVIHTPRNGAGVPSGTALGLFGTRGYDALASAAAGRPGSPEASPQWAQSRLSVGDRDITDLAVVVQQAVSISGRVEFFGSAPAPAADRLARMGVIIESASRALGEQDFTAAPARVSASGAFAISGVSPGEYMLRSSGSAPFSTLRSITIAGRDMTDLPITVDAAGLREVVLTFDDTALTRLPGKLAGAKAVTGADAIMVVAFPTDRRLWANPTAAGRRFRASGVDQKGAFTLTGLPEGEYHVAPVPDRFGIVWQDASNLELLARTATQVRVSAGTNQLLEVRR